VAVNLRVGQVLEADIEALDLTIPATIEEMVPAAHPDARNFHLKMRIEYQSGLYPGLFARIRIPQGEAQVLAIPQDYILKVGQLDIVWILQRGRIERRFIRLGRPLSDGRIGIISGLEGGERLVSPENARASLD
ncbi:MAG: efflux RND transporter periplasmic adaptor subunit, partial [Gammaproteobacteria bacterium]